MSKWTNWFTTDKAETVLTEEEKIKKEKRKKLRIVLGVIILVLAILYLVIPDFRAGTNGAISALSNLSLEGVIAYIQQFGGYAMAISFVLMVLGSVIAPIPSFLVTLANAAIFGWVQGAILSWSSAMVGAALCYFIAHAFGRDAVVKFTTEGALNTLDGYFEKYGKHTILVCRLLPFMSFDIVSYAAGLTAMSFGSFFLATGLGQLPATIVYSYVGGQFSGGAKNLFIGLMMLFALSIMGYIIKQVYNEKNKVKEPVE